MHTHLLYLILLLFIYTNVKSQCTPEPNEADYSCSGGNGASSDGITISSGETYWFTGGPTTYTSQVTVQANGILVICGDLTINDLRIEASDPNYGLVVIKDGGSLTLPNNTTMVGKIYNFGSLTAKEDFLISNTAVSELINCSTGIFTVEAGSSNMFRVGGAGGNFMNYGESTFNAEVTNNSGGTFCFDEFASTTINADWNNNGANSYFVNGNPACIKFNYTTNVTFNSDITSTSDLNICRAVGAGTINKPGSATVTNDCDNCNDVLPIELVYFSVKYIGNRSIFSWETASEINNDYFTLQASIDGITFDNIKNIQGAGNSSYNITYEEVIELNESSYMYFRLKQTDYNGQYTYSKITVSKNKSLENNVRINKEDDNYVIDLNLYSSSSVVIKVIDVSGMVIEKINIRQLNTGNHIIKLKYLKDGVYNVIIDLSNQVFTKRILVN